MRKLARLFKGRLVMTVIYIGDRDFSFIFALNLITIYADLECLLE